MLAAASLLGSLVGLSLAGNLVGAASVSKLNTAKHVKTNTFARASSLPPSCPCCALSGLDADKLYDRPTSSSEQLHRRRRRLHPGAQPPSLGPASSAAPTTTSSELTLARTPRTQSSSSFNVSNFDVFNETESFGLVDKTTGRWSNLTECVPVPRTACALDLPLTHSFSLPLQVRPQAQRRGRRPDQLQGHLHRPPRRGLPCAPRSASRSPRRIPAHAARLHPAFRPADNQAQSFYGTPAWNCYWSLQSGDGNNTWNDAELTQLGIAQAEENNAAWKTQIESGVPLPQKLYSSPMRRSTATLNITWCVVPSSLSARSAPLMCTSPRPHRRSDILLNHKGFTPVIKEHFRESIGLHTCDERSNKTVIAGLYPTWEFEPSFTHNDQLVRLSPPSARCAWLVLWAALNDRCGTLTRVGRCTLRSQYTPDFQETSAQQTVRMQQLFNELFATDDSAFIYIACHSGVIGVRPLSPRPPVRIRWPAHSSTPTLTLPALRSSLQSSFRALGHPVFSVQTGGMVPMLIKAVGHPNIAQAALTAGNSKYILMPCAWAS